MASQVIIIAATLAFANAGFIGSPAVSTYSAAPVVARSVAPVVSSYAAPAHLAYSAPALSRSVVSTYTNHHSGSLVSAYSAPAFPLVSAYAAPVAYSAYSAPVGYRSPVAPW